MTGHRHFKDVIVDHKGVGSDHKELFGSLYSVKGYGSFIAVAYACISIIIVQIFNNELLAYIDNLVNILGLKVN